MIDLGGLGHLSILHTCAMGGRVAVLLRSPDKEDEAKELAAGLFVNTDSGSIANALTEWERGADIIPATAPAAELMAPVLPGLAPDGTLVVLAVAPDEIMVATMNLVPSRLYLMGSPSGSRKDIRDALKFAAEHDIRPRITRHSLEGVGNLLREMRDARRMPARPCCVSY